MSNYESAYYVYFVFFKVGEDNKILKGHKYELVSFDDYSSTGKFLEKGEYGQYYFKDSSGNYTSDMYPFNILPKFLKESIDNINTYDEFSTYASNHNLNINTFTSGRHNDLTGARISFYVPVKIKEVSGTTVYKRKDLGIALYSRIEMFYIPNTNIRIPVNSLFIMLIILCITSLLMVKKLNKKVFLRFK